jgi:hypothetical protein
MAACTRNLRDGNLVIRDGTGTPNTLDIPIDNGDLSFTESMPTTTIKNRGRLDHRRAGDEMEMEVSFSVKFTQYAYASGASTGVGVVDALKKTNGASAWVSTHDACSPYSVDLVFNIIDPSDTTKQETLVFPKFHAESIQFSEGDEADTLQVSGRSFATQPTRTYGTIA